MKYEYYPKGVCPVKIDFEMEEGKVSNIAFTGGCNGNLKALSMLLDGWDADEIVNKLEGNTCGLKSTSCADQLAQAIKQAKAGD